MAIGTLPVVLGTGVHGSRPAASAVGKGGVYACSTHSLIYQTDGSSWTTWATLTGTGLADPMTTRGDIIVRNSSNVSARLATGAAGSVFVGGTDPAYEVRTIGTFTPTWTGSGGNPALVNGTLTGHYQKIADKLYWLCIVLTYGSSSTAGTGTWNFGNLPFTIKTTTPLEQTISMNVRDAGTTRFVGNANFTQGTTTTNICTVAETAGAKALAATVPITWATGDQVFIEGVVATD